MKQLKEVKVKYAFIRGEEAPTFIGDVKRELRCDFYCRECNSDLIPVIPTTENHRQWHYRHAVKSGCGGGRETMLHQRAKIVLENSSSLCSSKHGEIHYTNAVKEKLLEFIKPDVTAEHNGEKILFEIAVTHPMEVGKLAHLQDHKLRCIEIDLSEWIKNEPDQEVLEREVLRNPKNRIDLFWNDKLVEISVPPKPSLLEQIVKSVFVAALAGGAVYLLNFLFGKKPKSKRRSSGNKKR